MHASSTPRLSKSQRRRGMLLANVQAALWAVGNGLTTGTLVIFLAMELSARGIQLSLLLALPAVIGLLRLATPAIAGVAGVKRTTIAALTASYVLICFLPAAAIPRVVSPASAVRFFIALICVHQLLEYIGQVTLWRWFAELVPLRLRGRYFARRQQWQLAVLIPTLLISGLFADSWRVDNVMPPGQKLLGYTLPIELGALMLLASVLPLVWMPGGVERVAPVQRRASGAYKIALLDGRFHRLLLFGCWISFFNGLTQTAQSAYPKWILGFDVLAMAMLRTVMQFGQIGLSPLVGRFSDRFGNRPTLIVCQMIVATGPLFYLLSSRERPWWIVGAWIAWSAYVGLNVCLPNLTLKLAPASDPSAYVAIYFALTSVAYAASTVLGGYLVDRFLGGEFYIAGYVFDHFHYLFYVGWIGRTLSILLLLFLIEPGAVPWSHILKLWGGRITSATPPVEKEIHPLDRPD